MDINSIELTSGLIALACAGFFSFAWAVKVVFIAPDGMPPKMKQLSVTALICFIFQGFVLGMSNRSSIPIVFAGCALYIVALGLFWWSIPYARLGSLRVAFARQDAPNELLMVGPYRFIRHPFYASYLLYWLAGVLAAETLWLTPTLLIMIWFYGSAIRQEELELLRGPQGEIYGLYRRRVGALFPRILGVLSGR